MRRVGLIALGLFGAALLLGCGGSGPKLAKVSGMVTLDGVPYANALVNFQPMATGDNPNPGVGSVGRTDASGRYRLMTINKEDGAVVGLHRVRITTVPGHGAMVEETNKLGTPDDAPGAGPKSKTEMDPIPLEWNENSKIEFEVRTGGTDQAHFDIVTKKRK